MKFDNRSSIDAKCARLSAGKLLIPFVAIACVALQGCGGGPATTVNNAALPVVTKSAPVIAGSPATQATAGQSYTFKPQASDADQDALTFQIANKPAWASFNPGTGEISGTPTAANVGASANVTISVSDGTNSVSLPAFSISVLAGASTSGNATVSWLPPTSRTDGTTLTSLQGYRIYYGTSPDALTTVVTIDNPGLATYVIENLTSGTYYFSVTAVDSGGESGFSNTVSKTIG